MKITNLLKHELSLYTKNWSLVISMFVSVCISSFYVWFSSQNIFNIGHASLNILFSTYYWLLMIFVPYITMGKICDEKSSGTLELIMSKAIKTSNIITAKWLASFIIILILLLSTIPFCITIGQLGNLDWGATLGGYFALMLHGSMIISISLFTSANSKSSFNALFSTWIILLIILAIPPTILLFDMKGAWDIVLMRFSLNEYFKYMGSGLIYIHGIVLYISITTIFGVLTGFSLTKETHYKKDTIKRFAIIVCALIIIGGSYCFPLRADLTSSGKFSLSPVTVTTIKKNNIPVTINVFYSENIPAESLRFSRELFMLLRSFRAESNAPFVVKNIIVENEENRLFAKSNGVQPIIIRNERDDSDEECYFGISIQVGEESKTTITPLTPHTPVEYELTRAIRLASVEAKPNIGFVYGHGESAPELITSLLTELGKSSTITPANLRNRNSLNGVDVVCIIGANTPFSMTELTNLHNYLEEGGRAFIALNHANGRVHNLQGSNWFTINRTGIEDLLGYMGMKINYDLIIDNNCGTLNISDQNKNITSNQNVRFPYFPVITHFSNHIITSGLNSMMLPFTSSIEQTRTETPYVFQSLAKTSSISGTKNAPVEYNPRIMWQKKDFQAPNKSIAALLTNEINGSAVVAITNSIFINDELIKVFGNDNIKFAINSIEWLADNSGLIELRNKFTTYPTIEKLDNSVIGIIKVVNATLPLLIILLILFLGHRKLR